MMVSFKNTDIPVWKIRLGTVVSWELFSVHYGHIVSMSIRDGYTHMITVAITKDKNVTLKAQEITWLEPH